MFLFFRFKSPIFKNFIFWGHMKVFVTTGGQWIRNLRIRKTLFFYVEVKTFFACRDLNNYFYETLFVFNFIYRVSGNFSAYWYDHMTSVLNYIQGKLALLPFFEVRLSRNLEYSAILLGLTHIVKMSFQNFQMMFKCLMILQLVTSGIF